jgi:hypothetical protein
VGHGAKDYSANGTSWDYFPHDPARSRAHRWGEDGLAGFSDDHSRLCLGLALWNGRDPIPKERLFGGNSNWRGPVWMPVNYLLIESLQRFQHYYGDDFKVECPTGSGRFVTLAEAAAEISLRLGRLFLKGPDGPRPAMFEHPKLAEDPQFKDHVLFYEYFHGDTGRGVGASRQTGWTGLIARLLQPRNDVV